jgi:hypothetical protein
MNLVRDVVLNWYIQPLAVPSFAKTSMLFSNKVKLILLYMSKRFITDFLFQGNGYENQDGQSSGWSDVHFLEKFHV